MATVARKPLSQPGDLLLVVHDFIARSPDELSLARGDRIELIERDDDFGDGWFLGRHMQNGNTGLFPEVYTTPAPRQIPGVYPRASAQLARESVGTSDEQSIRTSTSSLPIQINSADKTPTMSEPNTPQAINATTPLQTSSTAPTPLAKPALSTIPRSLSMAISATQASPVMNETLSVIEEHITDMNTPRHSLVTGGGRVINDSGSEYSSHLDNRLSYINGHETDEEDHIVLTEQEVQTWSPARVAEYLADVGVDKRHCEIFKEQEISGEVLLGMDQSTIFLKEFELGPVGPRLRTWLKIKALQQEVKNAKAAAPNSEYGAMEEAGVDASRTRSTSVGTVLPRIPSLMEGAGARASQQQRRRTSSQVQSALVEPTPPLAPVPQSPVVQSPLIESPARPSAASVRSLNQNRRHSSIDFNASPLTPKSADAIKPTSSSGVSHHKQPSFDRNWTMGLATATANGRPSSAATHAHSFSLESPEFDRAAGEFGLTVVSPTELDRGYFSGGEIDNRKAGRNVLRKRESPSHSRNSSYHSDMRRSGYRRSSRMETKESIQDVIPQMSPAAKVYFSINQKRDRATSGPDMSKPLVLSRELPPTVTKLEYGSTPSIDAIASTPNLAGSETSSLGRASPSPAVQNHSLFGKKNRATGLRAISDAVTGREKALISTSSSGENVPSPIKESPLNSPTRTGSSTPSGTSKSFDLENEGIVKSATGSSGGVTPSAGRRKSKKTTSAYTRGLEKKGPKEQMIGCDYSGWMKKKSSTLMATWKTRLFVLRGRRLSYYYSEFDTEEKGVIDISSHRVLPATNDRLTGLHATITGATSSPSSPQNPSIATAASTDEAAHADLAIDFPPGMFIFKLMPPRTGLSKAVNFTKPTIHYFAVDSVQQGRLWMAALMKATIDRDTSQDVVSTYQQKTISLAKARAMRQRPPALMGDDDVKNSGDETSEKQGLGISSLSGERSENDGTECADAEDEKKEEAPSMDEKATILPVSASSPASIAGDTEKNEVPT